MGMYTHLQLDVEIAGKYAAEVQDYIDSVPRLTCTSYYFPDTGAHWLEYDTIIKDRDGSPLTIVHANVSLKNYNSEIENYLEFLGGKIRGAFYYEDESGLEMVGYMRYETVALPTLILSDGERLHLRGVTLDAKPSL